MENIVDYSNEMLDRISDMGMEPDTVKEIADAFGYDFDDAVKKLEDGAIMYVGDPTFRGDVDKMVGEWYVYDMLGSPAELGKETLERYFDAEAFGRDLCIENYVVETDNNGVWMEFC